MRSLELVTIPEDYYHRHHHLSLISPYRLLVAKDSVCELIVDPHRVTVAAVEVDQVLCDLPNSRYRWSDLVELRATDSVEVA